MFDLVIRGTTVVAAQDIGPCDIAIRDGRIAALAAHGTFAGRDARRIVDAGDRIVMPGGIDPHVHCLWPLMFADGTTGQTERPAVVSRAALYGGTTTLIDFARWHEGTTIRQSLERRERDWAGQCYCDYGYHILLEGRMPPEIFGEVGEAVRAGYPTVKLFTTEILPMRRGRMLDFGDIWEVFQAVAAAGGMCVVHGEDNDIVMHMYGKLIREGRTRYEHLAEVHNTLSEDLSFRRVIRLAESVPGMALYFMHVSAATGAQAIREARARGSAVYGETLHQYLMFTADDYRSPNGQIYHTYPSLKSKADQEALWAATVDDTIHTVATDELCCSLKVKTQGDRIYDTTGGNSGVEPRLAIMYSEMVKRRGHTLRQFVDLTSTNAAKLMGLHPRKGVLAVGSDADIAVLDPTHRTRVSLDMLHESDYSPWEGHEVYAWPAMTVLRGKIVVEDGRFTGDLGDGRFQLRRIADDVRSGARR